MTITGDINMSFDRMAVEIPKMENKALNTGAYYLKEQVKSAFVSKMPTATRPVRNQTVSGGYKITSGEALIDAVRQSKVHGNTTTVHILGAGGKGSPLFIARFYELGNFRKSPRYQKTYRGKKLKKKKRLGDLPAYHFFGPTVDQYLNNTLKIMGNVFEKYIGRYLNGQ